MGALMRAQRSPATKVNVFHAPKGTRPVTRSPFGARPCERVMLVLTAVSSMKTRRVESSSPCSRIQRRRARATSARSCSEACRTFFERDAVALQKTKQRSAAAGYLALVHRSHDLVECPVLLLLNEGDNLLEIIVQRRAAPPAGFGFVSSLIAPCLMPPHSRADANGVAFRRLVPGRSLVNRFNNAFAQIRRIRSCDGSPRRRITLQDSALSHPLGIPIQLQRKPL